MKTVEQFREEKKSEPGVIFELEDVESLEIGNKLDSGMIIFSKNKRTLRTLHWINVGKELKQYTSNIYTIKSDGSAEYFGRNFITDEIFEEYMNQIK